MQTFQLNPGILQNNLLVSISEDTPSYLQAIALKSMVNTPDSRWLEPLFLRWFSKVCGLLSMSSKPYNPTKKQAIANSRLCLAIARSKYRNSTNDVFGLVGVSWKWHTESMCQLMLMSASDIRRLIQ